MRMLRARACLKNSLSSSSEMALPLQPCACTRRLNLIFRACNPAPSCCLCQALSPLCYLLYTASTSLLQERLVMLQQCKAPCPTKFGGVLTIWASVQLGFRCWGCSGM